MKKVLFLIITVALCTSLIAQPYKKPPVTYHQAIPFTENVTKTGAETQDADATTPMQRTSTMLSASGSALALIGETHHYLSTNTNARNTISFRPNSPHAAAVWTMSSRQSATRGTGINYYDIADESWGTPPSVTERIESMRTGWGTHGFTNQGEIVVSHNGNTNNTGGLVISTRDNWGTGAWNEYVLKCSPYTMSEDWDGLETYETTGLLWPTMVANGDIVHLVAVTEQAPSSSSATICDAYALGYPVNGIKYPSVPLYYRSSDGGKTWDIQEHNFHAEGMTEYEIRRTSGDNYVLAARGNHIVLLYASKYGYIHYMESRDNGNTWARKEVYDCDAFADPAADLPARLVPTTGAIYIDENHKVHVAFGTQIYAKRNAPCDIVHWPVVQSGLVYWNDAYEPVNWEDLAANELDAGHITPFDPLHAFLQYPRYIELPTVLGFDKFYRWPEGPNYITDQFRDNGWAIYPRIVAQGEKVYLSYQSPLDWPLSIGYEFYRGIFVTVSEDDGATWKVQENTSWVSYHPELFQVNWDNYVGPIYDNPDDPDDFDWNPTTIVVTKESNNAYPTMSTNTKDWRIFLQWYLTPPYGDLFPSFDPSLVYTFNQGLWKFPEFNNIREVWQGKWNKIAENPQPAIHAKIYPNPATDGMVNVKVDTNAPFSVTVTNIMGQVVHTIKEAQNIAEINVSNFVPGVYIVNVRTGGATTSQKLIVK